MRQQGICKKPGEHHQHLCELQSTLTKAELAELHKNPKYVCGNCGGRVHSGRNLCDPKRIRT